MVHADRRRIAGLARGYGVHVLPPESRVGGMGAEPAIPLHSGPRDGGVEGFLVRHGVIVHCCAPTPVLSTILSGEHEKLDSVIRIPGFAEQPPGSS